MLSLFLKEILLQWTLGWTESESSLIKKLKVLLNQFQEKDENMA